MRRRLASLLVIASCSSGSAPAPQVVPEPARPPQRGAPGANIEIAAITDDGGAAVTQDGFGGTRLWPSLDGSLEPIVVHAVTARELAIGRDGSGFAIATLDAAGALEVIRIAATGERRSRAQIAGEVAVEQLVMTRRGVLALRADQTLALIAPSGIELARFVPPSGERIVSVLARGGHTIALLRHGSVHARSIDLDAVQWGGESPKLAIDPAHVALAPDGKHLAAGAVGSIAIVDLATGKAGAPIVCAAPPQAQPQLVGMPITTAGPIPLGFVDDATIVCFDRNAVTWWGVHGELRQHPTVATSPELVAVATGLVVTADRVSLELSTAGDRHQYLGYALTNPDQVHPSPGGLTLAKDDQPRLLLDRDLHARRRLETPSDRRDLEEVLPLDDRYTLVSHADTDGDRRRHRISLVDTGRHAVLQSLGVESLSYELRYEPATHLLATTEDTAVALVPYEPATKTFGTPRRIIGPPGDIHLTDPALADGVVAVVVYLDTGRTTVAELRRGDTAASRTYEVFGNFAAVDRAGRVYIVDGDVATLYTSAPPGVVHKEGPQATRVASFVAHDRPVIRPSPDATSILILGDNQIRMLDANGHERWSVLATLAIDVDWVDGAPYARFASGIAKLDPVTGKLGARSCGWAFGLSPTVLDSAADGPSVCDE